MHTKKTYFRHSAKVPSSSSSNTSKCKKFARRLSASSWSLDGQKNNNLVTYPALHAVSTFSPTSTSVICNFGASSSSRPSSICGGSASGGFSGLTGGNGNGNGNALFGSIISEFPFSSFEVIRPTVIPASDAARPNARVSLFLFFIFFQHRSFVFITGEMAFKYEQCVEK